MSLFIALTIAGAVTYLFRASLVIANDRYGTPPWLEPRLRLVGPSILAAIVTSSLAVADGSTRLPEPAELLAVGAGFLAVRRTGNLGSALLVGLPVYWLATTLVGG